MVEEAKIYFVMGVSGSGKTTLGKALAQWLKIPFFDGDDFHPAENIARMSRGIPLQDADREGWLRRLNALAGEHTARGAVIACSALKEHYRDLLAQGVERQVVWIFLKGTYDEISERLEKRKGHYMPPSLLRSQFDDLQPPARAIEIPVSASVEEALQSLKAQLAPGGRPG
jgi:gluconokinase